MAAPPRPAPWLASHHLLVGAALSLVLSCGGPSAAPPAPAPAPTPQSAAPSAPVGTAPVAAVGEDAASPQPGAPQPVLPEPGLQDPVTAVPGFDEACRQRVEGPEADGECTTDADCATGGCSGEVCAPAAVIGELMTTCEVQPCFQLLDRCGCHDGRCTWTLKAAPAGG